jgi:hypothetical protein
VVAVLVAEELDQVIAEVEEQEEERDLEEAHLETIKLPEVALVLDEGDPVVHEVVLEVASVKDEVPQPQVPETLTIGLASINSSRETTIK